MTRLTASTARDRFSDTLNRVAYGQERIALVRNGKSIAALVPIEDVELLDRLEEQADLRAARRALKESSVSLDQIRAELGL